MILTKKILIGVVVFYLIILLLSWLIKDPDLNPDLEMKLKQDYVMQSDLNDIPEFSILGLNALHESVIPTFGKYAYYQGWAEYYSYLTEAFAGLMKQSSQQVQHLEKQLEDQQLKQAIDRVYQQWLMDEKVAFDARKQKERVAYDQNTTEELNLVQNQLNPDHLSIQEAQDTTYIQEVTLKDKYARFTQKNEKLVRKLHHRQQIYLQTLAKTPRKLSLAFQKSGLNKTLLVLHWITLGSLLNQSSSIQVQQTQLLNYLQDLQKWYAQCSEESLCLFYLQAISETLDVMVEQVQLKQFNTLPKLTKLVELTPILEHLSLSEAANLRVMSHLIGSAEIYQQADQVIQDHPEEFENKKFNFFFKWLIQPMLRTFVLPNGSANLYWTKQQTMLQLAQMNQFQLSETSWLKLQIPTQAITPKNFLGNLTAWMSNDLAIQLAAYQKVKLKIELIQFRRENAYVLDSQKWKNKPNFVEQTATGNLCIQNPLFEHFIQFEVQVRPQCISQHGILNAEYNVFFTHSEQQEHTRQMLENADQANW